jgi:hypothetical protein
MQADCSLTMTLPAFGPFGLRKLRQHFDYIVRYHKSSSGCREDGLTAEVLRRNSEAHVLVGKTTIRAINTLSGICIRLHSMPEFGNARLVSSSFCPRLFAI